MDLRQLIREEIELYLKEGAIKNLQIEISEILDEIGYSAEKVSLYDDGDKSYMKVVFASPLEDVDDFLESYEEETMNIFDLPSILKYISVNPNTYIFEVDMI